MIFNTPVRLLALLVVIVCGLAVAVARLAPRPARVALKSVPRYVVINGPFLTRGQSPTQVLDTETGKLEPLPVPAGEALEWASFSDWVDGDGERQVVGRWVAYQAERGKLPSVGNGLGRFAYPSGRPLDRLGDSPVPGSAPCWYPGAAPRVLFASIGGQLYECTFGATQPTGQVAPAKVRPVPWPNPPAGLHRPRVNQPVWPQSPRLNGYVLAAVSSLRDEVGGDYGPRRLWWLRLSPDGSSVAAGGRLFADADEDPAREECLPSVATLPDGACVLAYHRKEIGGDHEELFVVPITTEAADGPPSARRSESRLVTDRCVGTPAAFSADGRALYVVRGRRGELGVLGRYLRDRRSFSWSDEPPAVH